MRRADSGRGTSKAIFSLGVLAILGFIAVKMIPVFVHNYELQDHINQLSIQAMAGQHPSADSVRKSILDKADQLDLPVKPEDVKVTVTGSKITVDLNYTVPVDLVVYNWPLHFTPSAENRAL